MCVILVKYVKKTANTATSALQSGSKWVKKWDGTLVILCLENNSSKRVTYCTRQKAISPKLIATAQIVKNIR